MNEQNLIFDENNTKFPSHTINITTEGTPEEFWLYFEPIDLSKIFKKTKFLPAVKSSSHVDRWNTPGQKRTVYLESWDTAQEEILECLKPNFFKYKVSNFTFALKYFCKYAIWEWNMNLKYNKLSIVWTYTFYPKDFPFLKFVLKIFVKNIWKEYMELSMKNLVNDYIKYRENL